MTDQARADAERLLALIEAEDVLRLLRLWLVECPTDKRHTLTREQVEAVTASPTPAEPTQDADIRTRYDELLYAVSLKHPGESRHETALRYIRKAEQPSGIAAAALSPRTTDAPAGAQETPSAPTARKE